MELNSGPSVVVNKSGFFSSLARGFFGLAITVVICGTGLGIYGMRVVDSKLDSLLDFGGTAVSQMTEWREIMPPLVSDAFDDRPGGDYDQAVQVDAELIESGKHANRVVFRVTNEGEEAISWLALNVVLKDKAGHPVDDFRVYAATPLPLGEDDWRGPLRHGSTREFVQWMHRHYRAEAHSVSVEISELRLQNGSAATAVAAVSE